MSVRKVLPLFTVVLVAGLLAAGCPPKEVPPTGPTPAGPKATKPPTSEKVVPGIETKGPQVPKDKIVYFNPKDPKEVSEKPGKSKAGEELVAGTYQCPMHADQMSNKAGECPICKMPLKLVTVADAEKKLAEKQVGKEKGGMPPM
jgi:hypothetical protein